MPKLQQRFMAGYVKPFLYDLSPYDRTLYVDADTEFRQYPMEGFKRLNKEDFLIYKFDAKDNHVSLIKAKSLTGFNRKCIEDTIEDAKKNNEPFPGLICSGVIFFKKSPAVSQLFKDWYSEWMKYYEWDEQIPLIRVIRNHKDVKTGYLDIRWNCKGEYPRNQIIHHVWDGRAARD
jgi:hypothetical protein